MALADFDFISKCGIDKSVIKPVIMIEDGGPDENPRYQKTIHVAVHHFLKHNLDAIFIATNSPGRSAFNRVERRMAPLSRELAGVILHEHYGSHLDTQRKTTDFILEKQNFEYTGKALAEIWSNVVIDSCPTVAEYINRPRQFRNEYRQIIFKR